MSKYLFLIILSLSFYITSCKENSNPVKEKENINPVSRCYFVGLDIKFKDTCSYNFVITFLSSFDSVTINGTQLGSNFDIYADSGDYNYWSGYFKNDSTIQYLFRTNPASDSLILKFVLSGKKSIEEEKLRFNGISNLHIINVEKHPNIVSVDVPDNFEAEWTEKFKQYPFISQVYAVGVCFD